jgi:phosphatidylserine/phosphatidylglycerophosphate/cardiolipin synthase-like enzyme
MSDNIYKVYVEAMKNAVDYQHFFNDSTGDAKVVLTEFINSAENSVRIFARSLNHEIYSDLELMYAIKKALDRKVHFDIMIQSEEPDEKSFRLVSLLEDSKYAGLVSFEKKKGVGLNHNICIVDSNKFHFEYNPDERKAEASWNDEVTTRKLDSLLDSIKKIAC